VSYKITVIYEDCTTLLSPKRGRISCRPMMYPYNLLPVLASLRAGRFEIGPIV